MKNLFLLLIFVLMFNVCYGADCSTLRNNIFSSKFTPANYQQNMQKVNVFYNNGCKENQGNRTVDKSYFLGNIAYFTSSNTSNKAKYLQDAYNYYTKSSSDNGFMAQQAALGLGFYYRDNEFYDNAIIWYKRAADNAIKASGNSGYIPAHIADAYILKGKCTDESFALYREAIRNLTDSSIRDYTNKNYSRMIDEITQKIYSADSYCNMKNLK